MRRACLGDMLLTVTSHASNSSCRSSRIVAKKSGAIGGPAGVISPPPARATGAGLAGNHRPRPTRQEQMERVKGQVNEGDTILVDHSDGRTFFVKVESGK